jgi:hypothetical protein
MITKIVRGEIHEKESALPARQARILLVNSPHQTRTIEIRRNATSARHLPH